MFRIWHEINNVNLNVSNNREVLGRELRALVFTAYTQESPFAVFTVEITYFFILYTFCHLQQNKFFFL